jgi:uncharacterized protein (TIGR03067 family)
MRTVLIVAAALLVAAKTTDGAKKDLDKMQGTWQVTLHEEEGKRMTAEQNKKANVKLIIKDDKFTMYFGKQLAGKGTIKLDPSKKPRVIDATMTSGPAKGKTMPGIYEFQGGQMKVCFAHPGTKRPNDFTAKKGSKRIYVWYQKVKAKK